MSQRRYLRRLCRIRTSDLGSNWNIFLEPRLMVKQSRKAHRTFDNASIFDREVQLSPTRARLEKKYRPRILRSWERGDPPF
jgi:hypothetical protein